MIVRQCVCVNPSYSVFAAKNVGIDGGKLTVNTMEFMNNLLLTALYIRWFWNMEIPRSEIRSNQLIELGVVQTEVETLDFRRDWSCTSFTSLKINHRMQFQAIWFYIEYRINGYDPESSHSLLKNSPSELFLHQQHSSCRFVCKTQMSSDRIAL